MQHRPRRMTVTHCHRSSPTRASCWLALYDVNLDNFGITGQVSYGEFSWEAAATLNRSRVLVSLPGFDPGLTLRIGATAR